MYKLEVATKITKELLLSKHSQEEYFEFYLGVPVKKGLFCSPAIIRRDAKPTCSFYKDAKGLLKYNDFAGPQFDFVGAVMHIYGIKYYDALRTIANDFNIVKIENREQNVAKIPFSGSELKVTEKAKIQVELQDFSEKELNWWASFGISPKTLAKFKVYSIKSVFLNGNYFMSSSETSPIYGYYGGENSDEIELWRLYMPTKIKYRFLSNWSSSMIQGAKQLPKDGELIVITKSFKDVMSMFEFGITAIAPNSENVVITPAQYNKLENKYNQIYVFYDNDLAGVKGAQKYRKKYGCKCIFIKRKYAKDFSDLYKSISKTQFWITVEELQEIFKNPDIKQTKHFYIF